jgi:NAD(P)-dependent dehydrogenase (short-subunit alcohol dehydrogenase family)
VGAYTAAKGAIHAFSRYLAVELGDDHIRVNAIAPGWVRTGMTEPMLTERGGGDYAKAAAVAALDTVQRRVAEPEEIAAPVCFLLSEEASFITGHLLVPDGGMTAL